MKYRICRRYTSISGTWYIIQKRILFWWYTYNIIFEDLNRANKILKFRLEGYNKNETICETPLIYKNENFIEEYPCKTHLIKF